MSGKCEGCGAEPGDSCFETCPTLHAPELADVHHPAVDAPAARPECRPGEAAVFVDWEAVARDLMWEIDRGAKGRERWRELIVAKHTHPEPAAVAALDRAAVVREFLARRVSAALGRIAACGSYDGAHHKQWVLDQVVRALTGTPADYNAWVLALGHWWDPGRAP